MSNTCRTHCMVDMETLGGAPRGAFFEVAAVFFNREQGEIQTYHRFVNYKSCIPHGGMIEGDVVKWWNKTDPSKIQYLHDHENEFMDCKDFMIEFTDLVRKIHKPVMWSKGSAYDLAILNYYMSKLGIVSPWHFRDERCVRTLFGLIPGVEYQYKFDGMVHNALDDVKHQLYILCEVFNRCNLSLD